MGMERDPRPVSLSFELALLAEGRTQEQGEDSRIGGTMFSWGLNAVCSVGCGFLPQ